MKIYTGNADGVKLEQVRKLDMGIMIAATPRSISRRYSQVACALDNGAYQCWRRGFPFQADRFRRTLTSAYTAGLRLDFVVAPDIVAGGLRSLEFSLRWAQGELLGTSHLALAVQDGMTIEDLRHNDVPAWFSHIFIGGTVEWKWQTGPMWVDYAHHAGMQCHMGRVGTLENLRRAQAMGIDSVDSTSFARNDSWHIVREFLGRRTLFESRRQALLLPRVRRRVCTGLGEVRPLRQAAARIPTMNAPDRYQVSSHTTGRQTLTVFRYKHEVYRWIRHSKRVARENGESSPEFAVIDQRKTPNRPRVFRWMIPLVITDPASVVALKIAYERQDLEHPATLHLSPWGRDDEPHVILEIETVEWAPIVLKSTATDHHEGYELWKRSVARRKRGR